MIVANSPPMATSTPNPIPHNEQQCISVTEGGEIAEPADPLLDFAICRRENNDPDEELDTSDVSRRVKDFLLKNGVSQRAFGEHVMGMTSGSVSDLLSRPKPWVMLSWRGRESYTKMAAFMRDEKHMQVCWILRVS